MADQRNTRKVHFSSVTAHYFDVTLDFSKLPTTGCAPIGLGRLRFSDSAVPLEQYEQQREPFRRTAVGLLLGHAARLELIGASAEGNDASVLRAVEAENVAILSGNGGEGEDDAWAHAEKVHSGYDTARPGEKRTGASGGYLEVDAEEEARRKQRAHDDRLQTQARKAEKRRCEGCRRYACIC